MRLSPSPSTSREAAYASDYSVEVGDDSSTWQTAATMTGGVGGTDMLSLDGSSGRYIRIHINKSDLDPYSSYSIFEIVVHVHDIRRPFATNSELRNAVKQYLGQGCSNDVNCQARSDYGGAVSPSGCCALIYHICVSYIPFCGSDWGLGRVPSVGFQQIVC